MSLAPVSGKAVDPSRPTPGGWGERFGAEQSAALQSLQRRVERAGTWLIHAHRGGREPALKVGRELISLWRHDEFRHLFQVITAVWGFGFFAQAAARVAIVQETSTGTALAVSNVLPFAVAALLTAWTVGYGQYHKRKGERLTAAAGARAELPDALDKPDDVTARPQRES